jgi:hypothetical protein
MRDPTRAEKGTSSRWGKESFVSDEARNRGQPCTSCHLVSTVLLSKIAARPNKSGIATHVKHLTEPPGSCQQRAPGLCYDTAQTAEEPARTPPLVNEQKTQNKGGKKNYIKWPTALLQYVRDL